MGFSETDEVWQIYLRVFRERLRDFGWTDGQNVKFEYRFTGENAERTRAATAELVASAGGKWLGVLRQIAPQVRRVAFVHVPEISANVAFIRVAESIAPPLGMTVTGAGLRDAADIERVLTDFAREPNGGLIVTPSPLTATKRDVIIATAAKLGLPAVCSFRFMSRAAAWFRMASTSWTRCERLPPMLTACYVAPTPPSSLCSCRPNSV
jgi:hypothetical protein